MNPLAVIDIETTGLNPYRHDRVVEISVVLVLPGKEMSDELTTVVNPERDAGPTSIHGLTASDVINAPRFLEIADAKGERAKALTLLSHRMDVPALSADRRNNDEKHNDYSVCGCSLCDRDKCVIVSRIKNHDRG